MADRWWQNKPAERYWLEATDREDIGANLQAPDADASGRDNWRYTLFRETAPGDVVFHYDANKARSSDGRELADLGGRGGSSGRPGGAMPASVVRSRSNSPATAFQSPASRG
jgi:hypothetical protein